MRSPTPEASALFFDWQGHWAMLLAAVAQVLALTWYLRAVRRAGRGGVRWPVPRTASFAVGILVVAYAVEGGISKYQRDNFTAHVVQLLLLVDLAPALLTAGAPVRLALQSLQGRPKRLVFGLFHSRAGRAVTRPLVVFVACTASMYAYYLSPLYSWSEQHPVSLVYVDLHWLVVGFLLWWVVLARDVLPRPPSTGARFALLLVCVPFEAYLGLEIASVTAPLYRAGNTLADTQTGGNVLWALAELFVVAVLAVLFVDWASDEERRALQADRQLDAALTAARTIGVPGWHDDGEDDRPGRGSLAQHE